MCVCVCVRACVCVRECAPPRPLGSTTSSWCLSTAVCAVGADVSSPRGPCAWRACGVRGRAPAGGGSGGILGETAALCAPTCRTAAPAADGAVQGGAGPARLWGGGRASRAGRVCACGHTHATGRRLRGGADLEEARIEQLRRERYGEGFGKGTQLDSSGIFESGTDSLVVLDGNESEERAREEKERRGLLRKPRTKSARAPDADDIYFVSSQDLYDSEQHDRPLPPPSRIRADPRAPEAKAAALAQDTLQGRV